MSETRLADKTVLYLSEDYVTSKVHHNLCQSVTEKGYGLKLFTINRGNYKKNIASTFGKIDYELRIDQLSCHRKLYRLLFSYKMRYKYRKLTTEVNLNNVGLCHAATLFSDGAIALKMKKERGIPYVVNIRGTDTNLYAKLMVHLWAKGREILREAERIIFISPTLRDALFESFPFRRMKDELIGKSVIIPNGIDDVWLQHIRTDRSELDVNSPKIIYVGVLDKNKNVLSLMDAVDGVVDDHPGIKLSIVGGNGSQEASIRKRCEQHPERYQMLGKIYDKDNLRELMRQHDVFAMVSHGETFGLVYVEALSQGLPILFSQGRGIDGFFYEKVGEAVNPEDVSSIVQGLKRILSHQEEYAIMGDKLQQFNWKMLADRYVELYKSIV